MKTIIICIFVYASMSCFTYAQTNKDSCGIWDAVIISIDKIDTCFIVTSVSVMIDCKPFGIYFEYYANESTIKELQLGMKLDVDKFKPIKGYWKYNWIYPEREREKRKIKHK